MRLDLYLVNNLGFESREKAQNSIKSGVVKIDGKIVLKSSFDVTTQKVEVTEEVNTYVSRAGKKLEKAIIDFKLDFNDKVVLDIGASTGGFTDVALKNGAKTVYCVDVGTNQLHDSLRNNDKVKVFENTNIIDFTTNTLFDYLVMDVSFISIKKIIPYLSKYLTENNSLIALIKPQYELGKQKIKNGIVKDSKLHIQVIKEVLESISELDLNVLNLIKSPIKGKMGNEEYLILVSRQSKKQTQFDIKDIVLEKTSMN